MTAIAPTWVSPCGRATLYLGDCRDVLPTLEAGSVDCVVADLPYGLGDSLNKGGGTWGKKYKGATAWDFLAKQEWVDDIIAMRVPSILWGGHNYAVPPSRCWLSWSKINAVPTMASVELAWTNLDRPAKEYRSGLDTTNRLHPTQKPLGLMIWCLGFAPASGTILDPFMGSGTTGVACIKTGRKFIGIEIDSGYFEIAKRRIIEAIETYDGPLFEAAKKDDATLFERESA